MRLAVNPFGYPTQSTITSLVPTMYQATYDTHLLRKPILAPAHFL